MNSADGAASNEFNGQCKTAGPKALQGMMLKSSVDSLL
jgi:hypothetical protein